MFKAYIIENEKYYQFQKYSFWTFLVFNPIMYIIFASLRIRDEWFVFTIFLFVIIMVLLALKFKPSKMINRHKIVISENLIQILNKKGEVIEEFAIDENSEMTVKSNYNLDVEEISFRKRKQNTIGNYIIIKNGDIVKKIYFVIDTYFMLNRLNGLVNKWENMGLHLEKNS